MEEREQVKILINEIICTDVRENSCVISPSENDIKLTQGKELDAGPHFFLNKL